MLEQFLNHIKQHSLFSDEDRVLLAVSGGLDSMVMLSLFKEAGFSFGVAHCNFQLRGVESNGDELFVRKSCEHLGVPFFSIQFETERYAKQNGLSIQIAARELRYAWFSELLEKEHFNYLATAHHFNDSIETVLLNWIHGGSLEGFTGIPVKNKQIIRPLLFALRSDLEQYAKKNKIDWREDASNITDDYQRNFLRHQVIPRLKEINPSLESTLQYGIKKVLGEEQFLQTSIADWKQHYLKEQGSSIRIEKKLIEKIPSAIVYKILKPYGFNFSQCEDVWMISNGQSGKEFFSTSHHLVIDREDIIITPKQQVWENVLIERNQNQANLGSRMMEIKRVHAEPSSDPNIAVLDADMLQFPLVWRKWKAGDYFHPLGMSHKRKLSDFLIDKKISMAEKNYVTVLESAGQIVWVVGYRIDDRFKLTVSTRSALSFSVQPYFI